VTLPLAALAVVVALATPKVFASQASRAFASHASAPSTGSPWGGEEKFQRTRIAPEGMPGPVRVEQIDQAGAIPESITANALINNNNGATGTSRFTQSETTLVAFGNTIIAGFNDSGSFASGAHFTGWSRSTDGGVTWTDGGLLPTSAIGDAGDPVLARDNTTGRIYFSTLGFSGAETIQVFRSTDNGVSWLAPVNGTPGGSDEDKQWITVDNFPGAGNGNVYLVSRRFGGPGPGQGIYHFRSTDHGATFGPTGGTLIVSGSQGAFVTVSPDHSVHAFWYAGSTLQVRRSTDQGVTFSAPFTVASGLTGGINGDLGLTGRRNGLATFSLFRTNEFPHAAVNPVSGNIYVTYNNNPAGVDKADVFLTQSTDGGVTWSVPARVNDDATTTDQWMPTVVVSTAGDKLGVFYYSRQQDPANNNLFKRYGRIATISGGTVTFAPSFAVSDTASLPEFGRDLAVAPTYMGDYDQVVATADAFHVIWSDNRDDLPGGAPRKDPNVYYNRIPFACSACVPGAEMFTDVPAGSPFCPFIEELARRGITSGCGGGNYCPGASVSRAQMAVFLSRTLEGSGYTPPPCVPGQEMFNDVPASNPFCPFIEELARRGISSGCGGGNYCPEASVSRAQMAIFLLRTLEGSGYTPPPCVPGQEMFNDVPASNPFCPWIEELARRGITGGCGDGNYCPSASVTRAQMAAFLVRTFSICPFL
jgi:hypothetical protein